MTLQTGFPRGPSAAAEHHFAKTLRGFREQMRIVFALAMRELHTRFGSNQSGIVWLFIEPLLLSMAIAAFKWAVGMGHNYPGIPIFVFALVSYLPYFMFRAIVGRAPGTIRANMSLLYHTRVRLVDVVLARHLLETAAIVVVMACIVLGVMMWTDTVPASIPTIALALLLLFLLANGLGMMAAAAAAVWKVAEKLIQPLVYLSLPFSGALVALHSLDQGFRSVLLWNPQAHLHEMVREGFFGELLPSYYSVGYVLFAVGVVNLLGFAALRAVRPKLAF
jgi:capsular polysaccharide transport system permease protein